MGANAEICLREVNITFGRERCDFPFQAHALSARENNFDERSHEMKAHAAEARLDLSILRERPPTSTSLDRLDAPGV